jgi:hypothetical protein
MAEISYTTPLYTKSGYGPMMLKLVYPDHLVVTDAEGFTRSYGREELTTDAPSADPPIGPGAITVTEEPIAEPGVPVVDAPPPPPAPQPQGRING